MKHFGRRLKELRTERGLTLRQVESVVGVSNAYLSQIETGKVDNPSFQVCVKLARLYGLTIEAFATLIEPPKRRNVEMGGDYEDKVDAPAPPPKRPIAPSATTDPDAPGVEPGVTIVSGVRFHQQRGFVHFHDDHTKRKVYVPVAAWWSAWQRLRAPATSDGETFSYRDIDNATLLTVTSVLREDENSVRVSMKIETAAAPETYDRVWHALEAFTNRTRDR